MDEPIEQLPYADWVDQDLLLHLAKSFPEATFSFVPPDMVSQILNFGGFSYVTGTDAYVKFPNPGAG